MDMKDLRIGYVPYSMNLEGPGDRRRFCFYTKKRNIQFEVASPDKDYDLLYVTSLADLSFWATYDKGNAKIVFEVIDSYLSVNKSDWKGQLRGLAKFVTRQSRYLQLDYRKAIQAMCQRADAVVCSTEEQKKDISEFCKNVHIILDVHSSVASHVKTDYSAGDVFNFVWEGLPFNVSSSFNEIREVLEYLQSKYKIALHLVTDLEYGKYMNKYGKQRTAELAKKIFPNTYIYEWNEQMCSTIITACDLALIPLPLDDTFLAGKPENKLLLLWRMGMPTVVSATPAYKRAMERSGLQMACRTQQDWQETLERYILDEAARREAGQNGKNFAESNYSEERILKLWDNLFESVL
jgi:glycosyltransferase involved in cell wall biosynthesis